MENTKLYPVWKELVKAADEWEYGTFHPHSELADILGVEPQTSKYFGYIAKARLQLITHGKLLECHVSKGYHVTEVNRYNEVTFNDIEKSRKYLSLSMLKNQFAPVERMTEQEKLKHDTFVVKTAGLWNMNETVYTEIVKVIAPIPKKFQIKEAKPKTKEEITNENN